jgi:hypothetical protein
MRKRWIISEGKLYGEYMVLLRKNQWRCSRINMELFYFFKEPRLSVVIRIPRLGWACRVARMEEVSVLRRLVIVQREGVRKVGEIRFESIKGCAGINELVGRRMEETSEGEQETVSLVPMVVVVMMMMVVMIGSKKCYDNDGQTSFEC